MALQSLARPPSNENFQWALTELNQFNKRCIISVLSNTFYRCPRSVHEKIGYKKKSSKSF